MLRPGSLSLPMNPPSPALPELVYQDAVAAQEPLELVTPIVDVDVAVRRWIAGRIARVVFNKLGMDFTKAAEVAAEHAPLSSWTHDANVALTALVRETQLFYTAHPDPPGFRGPDQWYRG